MTIQGLLTHTSISMRRAIAGGALLAVGLVVLGGSGDASAFTNRFVSPITADMGNNATIKHAIKKENTSVMDRISMVAYFDRASVNAGQVITIFDRDPNLQRCHAYFRNAAERANFIRVTLSIDSATATGTARSVTYVIPGNQVCATAPAGNNTIAGRNNSYFFRGYQVPSGFTTALAQADANTGGLYRVNINVQYGPGVITGTTGNDDNLKQQVTFRLRISNPPCGTTSQSNALTCARYIGVSPITAADGTNRNYSTLGLRDDDDKTLQYFRFGLPCNVTDPEVRNVTVYDIDNGNAIWGRMHFRIEKSTNNGVTYTPLSTTTGGSERLVVTGAPYTVTNGGTRIWQNDDIGNVENSIRFELQPGAVYRLAVDSVHSRNLFGVGLPTATIYGVIACNYSLAPSLTVASTSLVPGGSISGIVGGVTNGGDGTSLTPSAFGVTRFVLPRGTGTLVDGTSGNTTLPNNTNFGCQIANYIATGVTNCSNLFTDATGRTYPLGSTTRFNGNDPLAGVDVEPGDRVCYVSMVNNYNQSATTADWRYGNTICVLVGKRPNVQVWGNDLRVGGRYASDTTNTNDASIRTSLMRIGDYYGSWTEYGVLAPGYVDGMSSGSGLATGNPSGAQAQWSDLTFANTTSDTRCTGTGSGCFATGASMGYLPDVNQAVDDGIFAGVPITENTSGTIGATANFNSSRIIRRVGGTVTITGNITAAPGPYNDQNIPQMVIIADRINIEGSVTRVDAWLVATGTNGLINTCSDVADTASLTLTICDQPLEVNGPTIAKTLLMRRTAGADSAATADDPAERFNLRADTYIWAYDKAQKTGTIRTSYMRELAPRY